MSAVIALMFLGLMALHVKRLKISSANINTVDLMEWKIFTNITIIRLMVFLARLRTYLPIEIDRKLEAAEDPKWNSPRSFFAWLNHFVCSGNGNVIIVWHFYACWNFYNYFSCTARMFNPNYYWGIITCDWYCWYGSIQTLRF